MTITIEKNTKINNVTLSQQSGVVLFFALIALVVMSLAAVALIRSVDTNSLIAGNLSFKQSTLNSADTGTELAISWLKAQNANPNTFNANSIANGYYATIANDPKATLNSGSGNYVEKLPDSQGNIVRYIIQRMSRTAGAPTSANSTLGPPNPNGNDATGSGGNCYGPCGANKGMPRVMYRITTAVIAPKGTVSYIQTFVY